MRLCLILFLVLLARIGYAQKDELFGTVNDSAHHGFVISANGNFDIPAGDMATRFGLSYRIGPSVVYKTKKNWMFGVKADFLSGSDIKEDSLFSNIIDQHKAILNINGIETGVGTFERGYILGLQVGKLIYTSKKNNDNGILLMLSAGFIQHKIQIYVRDNDVPSLQGDYLKGYDRLTNGGFFVSYLGYSCFSKDKFINFHIGLDFMVAFTQGRRDYLFDIMRADNKQRTDILFGIRGGWYIPIFKRKSEETFFE